MTREQIEALIARERSKPWYDADVPVALDMLLRALPVLEAARKLTPLYDEWAVVTGRAEADVELRIVREAENVEVAIREFDRDAT